MPKRNYIPLGCDQQGRYVDGAHAASEFTEDDPIGSPWVWSDLLVAVVAVAAAWVIVAAFGGL